MQEVTGSSPVSPTIKNNGLRKFTRNPFSFDTHQDAAFQGILNMKRIGILAYGSLIDNPGPELGPNTVAKIEGVNTPFRVEFARKSRSRNYAPTLVPVAESGASVKGVILILRDGISEIEAKNMLWRREVNRFDTRKIYQPHANPGDNKVYVESLEHFKGIDMVYYVRIASNIQPLTPAYLAKLAIQSVNLKKKDQGRDGISYLINAKANGIQTPLMSAYEQEILQRMNAKNLEEALSSQINLLKENAGSSHAP